MTTTKKHKDGTLRLRGWDYTSKASYFITANCKDRVHHFGEVIDGEMHRSAIGQLAHDLWPQMQQHYPWAQPGPYIIMPDHMHGIITLVNDGSFSPFSGCAINRAPTEGAEGAPTEGAEGAPTEGAEGAPTEGIEGPSPGGITGPNNPMLLKSLGRIMRWYKGRTSFEARPLQPDFAWQSRYYEHFIRHPDAYRRITWYMQHNPANWKAGLKIK